MKDEEKRTVLQWRNHMSIRQWMYNTNIIEWEDHLKFLNGLKNDPTKKYWLVKRENKDIGVSSIVDIDDKSGEWGYYLAPDLHGTNLGVEFYLFTLNFLFNIVGMEFLKGYAAVKNKGANSFNDLFGFSKKPVTKIIDKKSTEFFYRELSVDTFNNKIVNDQKIERLLKLTLTNI
ncbi:MAG: UDP-4-amino-4,6-dideoxy-N-acetyl-beta-L-altrosamine N-acetyltransferase [Bacteroidia bacterium]|nr:UDP-4-amino-4,6-dideoxy-N-acetyl-beta-L-altrosamine N-acetyltransferase [Bacteroidia bacterium]